MTQKPKPQTTEDGGGSPKPPKPPKPSEEQFQTHGQGYTVLHSIVERYFYFDPIQSGTD